MLTLYGWYGRLLSSAVMVTVLPIKSGTYFCALAVSRMVTTLPKVGRSCCLWKNNLLSLPDLLVVPEGLLLTRLLRIARAVEDIVDLASFWFCSAYVVVCKDASD